MKNPPLQQGHDGPRAPPLRPYQADTLQRMKILRGKCRPVRYRNRPWQDTNFC